MVCKSKIAVERCDDGKNFLKHFIKEGEQYLLAACDRDTQRKKLKETCEELGICGGQMTILGELSPVYIPPSHFMVFPTVATLPEPPVFVPNPEEVAEVITCSLTTLLDERIKQQEYRTIRGFRVRVPFYRIHDHKVWGATAVMLSELEHRLRAVM